MYNYIIVCIICWSPTLLLYVVALARYSNTIMDVAARTSLYVSGFLNFLVYGMQDRYLKVIDWFYLAKSFIMFSSGRKRLKSTLRVFLCFGDHT